MKAMESSKAAPAVVRNGVEAVSSQAAMQRKSQVHSAEASIPAPRSLQAPETAQYSQIQYVDGLGGHVAPANAMGSRANERTLSEITKPIAFGAGLPTSTLPPTSMHAKQVAETPITQRMGSHTDSSTRKSTVPRRDREWQEGRSSETPTYRRFDHAHSATQGIEASEVSAPTPKPIPLPAPVTESSTIAPALPLPVAFTPSWEVDCFLWPEVVKQIEQSHADAFQQIGKHLQVANRDGLKVMAIASGERGVGRSTVAMHMARSAAASGLKVALVDGDAFCPSLIDQLRLDVEHGWADCLFENVPLHEAAVFSIQDGITLFPLTSVISAQELHANLHRVTKLIKRISTAFDIVFIDANRLNLEQRDLVGVSSQETIIDAAIVVVDTELSIKEKVDSAVGILQSMGLSSIGLVENFQS
jgi:Mrp family chromosome partitioning ATPase